ncbi:sialyltransferase [Chloropicon primus]|uniref:Sialyltransferase n=1 Tax=Chloropicon primus TaxID=1764295 RepID=A0A5B8MPY2_9CHLO|nr:sialyltransferase [Chloropicon primus]UPR00876.1 sialyltransferase [Chloropicon primus]|eukprot:QDZ21665.1 sialyltransferase [Chloropicon primus]
MAFERRVLLMLLLLVGLRVVFYGNLNLVHSDPPPGRSVQEGVDPPGLDGSLAPVQPPEAEAKRANDAVDRKGRPSNAGSKGSDHSWTATKKAQRSKENKNVQEPTYVPKKKEPSWNVLNELRLVDSGIRLVLHKRQFIFYNATLGATTLRRYLEYFDGNETTQYVFPAGVFDHLPLEEPNWHFKRCAVVGNSGIVLLKEKGEEIDNHDAVFRLNLAPVKGFERYVGSKTYFNIVNAHNLKEILQGRRRWKSVDQTSRVVMFETASHFARYHLAKPLLDKYGEMKPVLLNPMFANHCHDIWIQLLKLLSKAKDKEFNRKPMSGFFATMMAIQVCEHVDLYGFDSYTSTTESNRYHYFDNVKGFTGRHSFDLAITIFKLIAKKGILTIMS